MLTLDEFFDKGIGYLDSDCDENYDGMCGYAIKCTRDDCKRDFDDICDILRIYDVPELIKRIKNIHNNFPDEFIVSTIISNNCDNIHVIFYNLLKLPSPSLENYKVVVQDYPDLYIYYDILAIMFLALPTIKGFLNLFEWFIEYTGIDPHSYNNIIFNLLFNNYHSLKYYENAMKIVNKYDYDINMKLYNKKYPMSMIFDNYGQCDKKILKLFIDNGADINLLSRKKINKFLVYGDENDIAFAINNGLDVHPKTIDYEEINTLLSFGLSYEEIIQIHINVLDDKK